MTDRPHGHLGAKSTRVAADRAILREHFGPYYIFVQRLGGLPAIYFIIGAIVGRQSGWSSAILYAAVAMVYSFLFHVYSTSYFAARSKIGLERFGKKTFGYRWSSLFIARMIIDHVVMMAALIWLGIIWFLVSGVALYFVDYAITILSQFALVGTEEHTSKVSGKTGGDKK
jgi:hypothetical protein